MDREIAKNELKKLEPNFLQAARKKVNGHISYICPNCGNGSGKTGDGIALDPHSKNGRHYKCFVCGINEDIIGLWKLHNNVSDDKKAFEGLYQYYSLPVGEKSVKAADKINHDKYYQECMKRVSETDYFVKRGFSTTTITKYKLGYDPHYKSGGREWAAVIIPTGAESFVVRNTNLQADKKDRYRKNGASQLYLKETLWNSNAPIFITEGELDALSIIEIGGNAVALGSTANYKQFLQAVQKQKPTQPIILALDNDEDGEKISQVLEDELVKLEIFVYRCNLYGAAKDANEALLLDRENFQQEVMRIQQEVQNIQDEEIKMQREEYLQTSAANHLQEFINGIADSVNTAYVSTGFNSLDKILDGGLYEGLYILGAISSLGKTTLVLQIADQIAAEATNVLIFSLEMARYELMAKSISRLTLREILSNAGKINDAKTTRGITTGSRYEFYSKTEREIINKAIEIYGGYAKNIYIHEGIGDIGTEQIRDEIKKHIFFTGKKPVVIIDYVQILAPYDIRATDKQNTDKAVLELKRISRDYKIPVIGISSFNRANYSVEVTMEAFKESGSLEYGSDVLIGLQLKGAGSKNFNANDAKQRNPREIELVILKNRNGATGKKIDFEYYPLFNYFKEIY